MDRVDSRSSKPREMLHGLRLEGFSKSDIWFLVCNRSGAKLFNTDDKFKTFTCVKEIANPEGRLKNRDIESDRPGASMGERGADYPVHGIVNKGSAKLKVMRRFAGTLSRLLRKLRAEYALPKCVLVAEPRLLGELRKQLDEPTKRFLTGCLQEDLLPLEDRVLKEHLERHFRLEGRAGRNPKRRGPHYGLAG